MNRWIDRPASPLRGALAAIALAALSACAYPPPHDGGPSPGSGGPTARSPLGVVSAIEPLARESSRGPGTGAAIGGAIGALIGRQIADGDSRGTATVVGAIAGAMIGHQIDKHQRGDGKPRVRITVALDSGGTVTVEAPDDAETQDLRPGDRVRVENQRVFRVARSTAPALPPVQSALT